MRRSGTAALALSLFLAMGAPALAAPAETSTVHYDFQFYDDDETPCVGVSDVSAELNAVLHTTVNGNGSHLSNTETGDFEARDNDGNLLASGRYTFTVSINFNAKKGIAKGVATLSIRGTFADGERLAVNLVDRFEDDFDTVSGIAQFNCHDGEGPQRLSYSEPSSP